MTFTLSRVSSPKPIIMSIHPAAFVGMYRLVSCTTTPASIAKAAIESATAIMSTPDRMGDAPSTDWKKTGK